MAKDPYQETTLIGESLTSPEGVLRLPAFLQLLQEATLGGSAYVGSGVEAVREKGYYWVVLSYRFEILAMGKRGDTITISTYPSPSKAFLYPRHYLVKNAQGDLLARGIAAWALLEQATHKPTFPAKNGFDPEGLILGTELPLPPTMPLGNLEHKEDRLVRPSDLDFNGHMNNIRYLDYALDLEEPFYAEKRQLASFQINFTSETPAGATMALFSSHEGSVSSYQGKHDGKTAFSCQLVFKDATGENR